GVDRHEQGQCRGTQIRWLPAGHELQRRPAAGAQNARPSFGARERYGPALIAPPHYQRATPGPEAPGFFFGASTPLPAPRPPAPPAVRRPVSAAPQSALNFGRSATEQDGRRVWT